MFNQIIANVAGKVREESLEGRPHLVVPVAMLAEGVWPGSKGPVFYPGDELVRNVSGWDHKPVVVYHPDLNGRPVTAADPTVLNNQSVGRLLRTSVSGGKLRSEAWLDKDRLTEVDKSGVILDNLLNQRPTEVSTGLGADLIQENGVWNSSAYGLKAVNYLPDHLAILPDRQGAYSLADGGGLLVTNELSFDDTECAVRKAVAAKVGKPGEYWDGYISDVYPDRAVYWYDGGLYQIGYKVSNNQVTLEGEPQPVVRVTEYRTTDGKMVGNARGTFLSNSERCHVDKKAKVDRLVANNVGWVETDRPVLMNMDDKALDRMLEIKAPEPVVQNTKTEPEVKPVPSPEVKGPEAKPAITITPEEQEILNEAKAARVQERTNLVSEIVANSGGVYTPADLSEQTMANLRKLHMVTKPKAPPAGGTQFPGGTVHSGNSYLGAGGFAEPLANAKTATVEPIKFGQMEFGKAG